MILGMAGDQAPQLAADDAVIDGGNPYHHDDIRRAKTLPAPILRPLLRLRHGPRPLDRVTAKLGRRLFEVPVGFKWFVDGLLDGSLGFGGEESAGASFIRMDGTVWTTDKDGIVPALLAAEITARMDRDPGEIYRDLTRELGDPVYDRVEAEATLNEKKLLATLSPEKGDLTELAGEEIEAVLTRAPGNNAPIGGLKVVAKSGWFAARPSGTESVYKIYAESFQGPDHLRRLLAEAQQIVGDALATAKAPQRSEGRRPSAGAEKTP